MEQIDPFAQLEHIVQFLDDLRMDTRRLTAALYLANIWSGSSNTIYDEHLPIYLARLCERWQPVIRGAMAERNADILIRRYGLDGHKRALLRELSAEYGVSQDRIRHLEHVSLRYLRRGGQDKELLQIALDVVTRVADSTS